MLSKHHLFHYPNMSPETPLIEYHPTKFSVKHKPPQEYDCAEREESIQFASNLYDEGVKLWTKHDLLDIEQQLARCAEREYFTVHQIDGAEARIKNPMFGVTTPPIW
jgi:hypothetical protein